MAEKSRASIVLRVQKSQFDRAMSHTMVALTHIKAGMLAVARAARTMLLIGGGSFALLIKRASDVQETVSMFEAVFKEQTEAAEKWANDTAKALNRSKVSIQGWMASLQDTFVPLGFARDEAMALSQQLTQLGIDLASFKNVAEGETLDLLTSAIVGNHEAVRRFGIILTEATVKQEMANMGYVKGGKVAESFAKVMARVSIIMRSSADAQGDAARTADSFANSLRGMLASVDELVVALGGAFLPAMTDLVIHLKDILKPIAEWAEANKESVVNLTVWTAKILLATAVLGPFVDLLFKVVTAVAAFKIHALLAADALKVAGGAAAGATVGFFPWIAAILGAMFALKFLISRIRELIMLSKGEDPALLAARAEEERLAAILASQEAEKEAQKIRHKTDREAAESAKKMLVVRRQVLKDAREAPLYTEAQQKAVDKLVTSLKEERDTLGLSTQELIKRKIGFQELDEVEKIQINNLLWEIQLKEKAKTKTEELKDAAKEYADELIVMAERHGDFRDAMGSLSKELGVAEGWLTQHEVDVKAIAEQYGVTVKEAERYVTLQEQITDVTKKERKEREKIVTLAGIANSAQAVYARIQAASLGGTAVTTASTTVTPNLINNPARVAVETKTVMERILEFLETFRTDLEFAGVLRQ